MIPDTKKRQMITLDKELSDTLDRMRMRAGVRHSTIISIALKRYFKELDDNQGSPSIFVQVNNDARQLEE